MPTIHEEENAESRRARGTAVRARVETARPEIVVPLPDDLPGLNAPLLDPPVLDPPDPDVRGHNVRDPDLPDQPTPTAPPAGPSPARDRVSHGDHSLPGYAQRQLRVRPAPRQPWFALPALVLASLAAAFFGWVSANPFWLALGHGYHGTATVVAFDPQGSAGAPCQARFVADGGVFTVASVTLSGVSDVGCRPGAELSAQMVSADASQAYLASTAGLHLRWLVGFAAVLLCGLVIAWATGAARFSGWQRAVALLASIGAPFLITAGMLLAAY